MRTRTLQPRTQFIFALLFSSLASVVLFVFGAFRNHSTGYSYLITNLVLAWLPLLLTGWLVNVLRRKLWSSWEALGASVLWLLFLPNSFYMVSDFIHLQAVQTPDILYDAVMFMSFIFVGIVLGLASVYLIHQEFRKRFSDAGSVVLVVAIFLLCSFAVYLGRDLRWNSWDVLINPGGLLFDVSDRLLHPSAYPQMFLTIFSFFVLLVSMYSLTWVANRLLRSETKPKL